MSPDSRTKVVNLNTSLNTTNQSMGNGRNRTFTGKSSKKMATYTQSTKKSKKINKI